MTTSNNPGCLKALLSICSSKKIYSSKSGIKATLIHGSTGRISPSNESYIQYTQYKETQKQSFPNKCFMKKEILPELKRAITLKGKSDYYHGSTIDDIGHLIPYLDDPLGRDNRYNRGFNAFYLSGTEVGVEREVNQETSSNQKIYMLKYTINFDQIRIVDLTDKDLEMINQLIFDCEELDEKHYQLSQRVGKYLLSLERLFDGFLVEGVQGDQDCRYNNLVLFHELEDFTKYKTGTKYVYEQC